MGGDGEGAGTRPGRGPGRGWGYVGGRFGVQVLPQGWGSSPAASLAVCTARGAAPARGGCSPAHHRGGGQSCLAKLGAGSQQGTCPTGLCWEPLTLSLTLGLQSRSARVSTVPRDHVPRDRAGQGGIGVPQGPGGGLQGPQPSRTSDSPALPSAALSISPAEPSVAPAHGPISVRVKVRFCSWGEQKSVFSPPAFPGRRSSSSK